MQTKHRTTKDRKPSVRQTGNTSAEIPELQDQNIAVNPSPPVFSLIRLWAVAVFLCVVWQPFALGFYLDDWGVSADAAQVGAAFSKARFGYFYSVDPSRPALVPFRYLLSSLLGDHTLLWQGSLLLVNVFVAFTLIRLICLLTRAKTPSKATVFGVGLCWLLFPWNAAARFWPVLLPNVFALGIFGMLCTHLIQGWYMQKHRAVMAAGIYLWLCLSYEAFYFQWIPIVLLGGALILAGRTRLGDVTRTAAGLMLAQVCALAWYMSSKSLVATQKPVSSGWSELLKANLLNLIPVIFASAAEIKIPFTICAILLASVIIVVCWKALFSLKGAAAVRHTSVLTLVCLAGGLLSVFAFTLGGRPVAPTGVETRSLMLFTFWVTIVAGILTLFTIEHLAVRGRTTFFVILGAFGTTLAVSDLLRAGDWATAWRLQQKILREAPVEELKKTPSGARILYVNPLDVNGAPIFSAPWDINHAMPLTYPFLGDRRFVVYSPWGGTMTWDGSRLAYQNQPPIETVSSLYVWTPSNMSFRKAAGPIRILQNFTVEELTRQ